MNILPIIVIGAAAYYLGKRKQKKKDKKGGKKALPAAERRGTVFPAGEVDVIEAKVGERFTVAIPEQAGLAYTWSLEASPPENTIELVKEEFDQVGEGGIGGAANHLFIFKAKKAGSGALVFHYMRGYEKGKVLPDKVLEIQTKVS
jgi:predicted secreted protein